MTTMTVTDALAELTLLEKRINSARVALDNNTLIAVVEVGKVPTGFKSRDDHAAQARASLQRVDALIDRSAKWMATSLESWGTGNTCKGSIPSSSV